MPVNELSRVNTWIRGRLASEPTLVTWSGGRLFSDSAPQEAASPMVVFAFLGGSDKVLTGTNRLSQAIYLIRAIAEGSSFDLVDDAADSIENVMFTPTQGTVVNEVRITSCFREQPFQRKDNERGVPVVYMGGFYRIRFQPSFQ